jgi:sulfatase maturation enzyme AslB (radical SAM superfamily)
MSLGRYCLPLTNGSFYNSITHQKCDESELGNQNMLAGQEHEALLSYLSEPKSVKLTIIPSMECNLRCQQCYVLHLLKKKDNNDWHNPDRIRSFRNRMKERFGEKFNAMFFIGGEPMLYPDFLDAVMPSSKGMELNMTTNGMWEFEKVRKVLDKLTHITFSIDGPPHRHNKIRRSIEQVADPFGVVYRNLHQTIKKCPHLEVTVQGCIIDNDFTWDETIQFQYLMELAGVQKDKIFLGPAVQTASFTPTDACRAAIRQEIRKVPCCDFRIGGNFILYQNNVYNSYHRINEVDKLGTIDDDVSTLLGRHREAILSTMPMLQDKVCMDECKAPGVCWGICTNSRHMTNGKPSSICDRAFKEEHVRNLANAISSPPNLH